MKFLELMETRMNGDKLALLKAIGEIGRVESFPVYLVGGAIRDIILDNQADDLDVVVEGNAGFIAHTIAGLLSGQVLSVSQFNTAKLMIGAHSLDIVGARSERYSKNGALPTITTGSIYQDLARRDFSINAMAFLISDLTHDQLIDPFHGVEDLNLRVVRALHDQSFADDATRIMRCIRYEQKLGFHMDSHTKQLMLENVAMLDTISGDRIRRELKLWMGSGHWLNIINEADRLGVMAALHEGLAGTSQISRDVKTRLMEALVSPMVYLGILSYNMNPIDLDGFIQRLRMPRSWVSLLRDTLVLRNTASGWKYDEMLPSQVYETLKPFDVCAIQVVAVSDQCARTRNMMELFLHKLRHDQPRLKGSDIISLGIEIGPVVGDTLDKLRAARMDGIVSTREDERNFVIKHMFS